MRTEVKHKTVEFEISWSNIQDQIATLIYAIGKGKIGPNDEILSIKLDYPGGYVSQDKIIKVEVIAQKGVKTLKFG